MSESLADRFERALEGVTPAPWVMAGGDDECCSRVGGIVSEAEQRRIDADATIHRGDYPESTAWIVVYPGVSPVQFVPQDNDEFFIFARNHAAEIIAALRRAEGMEESVELLAAFVAVMYGGGFDAEIPETVKTPLGIHVKIREIVKAARTALSKGTA